MDKDMQTFKSYDVLELVGHVLGMRTLRIDWVLHWKFKSGIFEKNKATRSNHQEPSIDYNRSFLPVMVLESPHTSLHSLDSSVYRLGSSIRESRIRSLTRPFFPFPTSLLLATLMSPSSTLQSFQGGDLLVMPILGRELGIIPQERTLRVGAG